MSTTSAFILLAMALVSVLVAAEEASVILDIPEGSESLLDGHADFSLLTEDEIRKLGIDSVVLRNAYAAMLVSPGVPGERGSSPGFAFTWQKAAFDDLSRRGNDAAPLLLDIMTRNQNTYYEAFVLRGASAIETIDIEPFLDYWRNFIRERTYEIDSNIEMVAPVFVEFGKDDDISMFQWLSEVRLDLAAAIHKGLSTRKEAFLRRGRPVSKSLLEWDLNPELDALIGNTKELGGMTDIDLMKLVGEKEEEIADRMAAADPPPPPPAVETPPAQKAPEKLNPRPPTRAEETPSPPSGGGSGFAIGLVAGAFALLAGVWLWLRGKSA